MTTVRASSAQVSYGHRISHPTGRPGPPTCRCPATSTATETGPAHITSPSPASSRSQVAPYPCGTIGFEVTEPVCQRRRSPSRAAAYSSTPPRVLGPSWPTATTGRRSRSYPPENSNPGMRHSPSTANSH